MWSSHQAGYAIAALALTGSVVAVGQGLPPPATLENISSCALEGTDVFITTGQGEQKRRYKFPWDASVDALCNAKGFAISPPPRSTDAAKEAPAARATSATAPLSTVAPGGSGFPPGSRRLQSDELKQMLSGGVVKTTYASGETVRVQYDDNGYVYYNGGQGAKLSGRWHIEGSSVCYVWSGGAPNSCVEIGLEGTQLYAKRNSGEIIRLELKK